MAARPPFRGPPRPPGCPEATGLPPSTSAPQTRRIKRSRFPLPRTAFPAFTAEELLLRKESVQTLYHTRCLYGIAFIDLCDQFKTGRPVQRHQEQWRADECQAPRGRANDSPLPWPRPQDRASWSRVPGSLQITDVALMRLLKTRQF